MFDDVLPAAVTLRGAVLPAAVSLSGAVASGVGSLPGTDVWEWSAFVRGELPDLPHIPELPARGPGADMIGRALGLLANISPGLSAQTSPDGWRFSGGATTSAPRLMRRAKSWLSEDLDSVQQQWADFEGTFKIQIAGPWTLAATVELPSGARALSDAGACRDIAAALGEAASLHVNDAKKRLPRARIMLQFDEPAVPGVLLGAVATQSGLGHLPPKRPLDVEQALADVFDRARQAGAIVGVHCCGGEPPIDMFLSASAQMISLDLTRANPADDALGRALESGVTVAVGLVSPTRSIGDVASTLAPLTALLNRLGIRVEDATEHLVVTPTCGLAGVGSARAVRDYYDAAKKVAAALCGEAWGGQA